MGAEKGKLVICDRCGESIFLKFLERRAGSNYGSDYDVYDELPENWLNETWIGYLCPKCAEEFKRWITKFMNGKVPSKWKLEDPEYLEEIHYE